MENKEYEAKKQECWREYFKHVVCGTDSHEYWFNKIFDRAYSLGKQIEPISQEEIEKAAEKYDSEHAYYNSNDVIECFVEGANFALGKQEKDAEDGSLWSRLTDDEKCEMQCRYYTNKCVLRDHRKRTGDKAQSKAVARIKLLENLFGKENLKIENK